MGTKGGRGSTGVLTGEGSGWVGCGGGGGGHVKGCVVSNAMLCSLALAARLTTSDRVGQMIGSYVRQGRGPRGVRFSADMQLPAPLPPRMPLRSGYMSGPVNP